MPENYLKPKVSSPAMLRKQRNGQYVNPPLYMTLGGMSGSSKLHRDTTANLAHERGPTVRGKKII
jgi:hypothetical protein